ncbi:hypothetical protein [Maritimibacter sp. HL-12]|uniref:hypothetical protein n=1 Tax=Maritimibacter sp. HL-12 TaxID=1162418 RepID=UPI001C37FBF2|nr:hypothetical protein [Maritimibacter sp. HL-12]
MCSKTTPVALGAMLAVFAPQVGTAGDFTNPIPYGHGTSDAVASATRMELERSRQNLINQQSMEYYVTTQDSANWVNAFMSGNTIILNGDNNVVTLSADNATSEQVSENNCLNSSNTTVLNGSEEYTAGGQSCGD